MMIILILLIFIYILILLRLYFHLRIHRFLIVMYLMYSYSAYKPITFLLLKKIILHYCIHVSLLGCHLSVKLFACVNSDLLTTL